MGAKKADAPKKDDATTQTIPSSSVRAGVILQLNFGETQTLLSPKKLTLASSESERKDHQSFMLSKAVFAVLVSSVSAARVRLDLYVEAG